LVVQMMKLKGDDKTIGEIAAECGVSPGYVSALRTRFQLSCKMVNPEIIRRRTKMELAANPTYFTELAERARQIEAEEAELAQRKQALEREKLVASMPHIEVDSQGAILKLYGLAHKLDQAQCRAPVNEVSKLRFK
jgi:hypothetical protein